MNKQAVLVVLAMRRTTLTRSLAHPKHFCTPTFDHWLGGDDLQERKKFLVACADALIVLPGGPGTWDELWEMACARHLELNTLPIVCVNVDGYYEPFREMLHRAYEDKLIRMEPEQIIWFADTAEDAVRFVENPAMETTPRKESNRRKSQQHGEHLWWGALQTFVVGAMFGIILSGRSHR